MSGLPELLPAACTRRCWRKKKCPPLVEECFAYKECTRADPNRDGQYGYDDFINAGKPLFEVEYKKHSPTNNVCARANAFSSMYKHVALDSYRVPCWKTN